MQDANNKRIVYKELFSYKDCSNGNGLNVAPEVVPRLKKFLKDDMVILGGHHIYDKELSIHGVLSNPDTVSTLSFEIAADIYSKARDDYKNITFVILVGDISDCESIKDNKLYEEFHEALLTHFPFPDAYSRILDKYNIDGGREIVPISELYLRNSADDLLEKLLELSDNENKEKILKIIPRKDTADSTTLVSESGIEVGKISEYVRRSKKLSTMHANCKLIQVELLDLLSQFNADRSIDIRNETSYKCNYQYGLLYHQLFPTLLELFGEHNERPVDIINTSLSYNPTVSDNLLATQRFWLYGGDPNLGLLESTPVSSYAK